jgi:membrane peptidoglycan carboxypeptidase
MSAQNPPRRGIVSAIAGIVGFSALSGLLVTVMVAPALAVTGITASSTIGIFDGLPEYIEIGQQPERNEIWASYNGEGSVNGQRLIATIYDQNRQEVGYDDISKFALDAAVAGEDRRFFEHGGVDVASVIRATVGNALAGGIESGSSTLSMQLVKQIFVQEALQEPTEEKRQAEYDKATATSFDRKLKEMKLAIGLEKKYTKKEILTAYLNIAFFGDNTYGIQAAAQRYFSVDAKDLTLPQAASLIAIVQYPELRGLDDPENFGDNQARRDVILDAMLGEGDITAEEHAEAIAIPVDEAFLLPSAATNGCVAALGYGTWFCDYVVKSVKDFEFLGATEVEREANWARGGYKLYTTLDLEVQVRAQDLVWQNANNQETFLQLGAAQVTVQPGTGRVLSMAINKIFDDSLEGGGAGSGAVNYATSLSYGGSIGFQGGSTYKLFTLIDWLESGKGVYERISGDQRTVNQATFKDTCEDGGGWGGPYPFKNDSGGNPGPVSVYDATRSSINGAFISMALQLDLCDIRKAAENLGVIRGDEEPLKTNPSSVLGTNEITPLSMAAAYAAVAAGGKYCAPIIIDRVVMPDGTEQVGQAPDCRQAITADVAATAAFALQGVMAGGTGSASNPGNGIPIMGKTGTTDSAVDTWIIASTTNATSAVWVGNTIGKVSLSSYSWQGTRGNQLRHAIQNGTMAILGAKYGGGQFPPAAASLLTGSGLQVPDVRGQSPEAAKALLEGLGFGFEVAGEVDSEVEAGKIAATDPPAGTSSAKGIVIKVYISKGNKVAFPDAVGDGETYDFATAAGILNGAGYNDITEVCEELPLGAVPGDPKDGKVKASNPSPGSFTVPGVPVTLTVTKVAC